MPASALSPSRRAVEVELGFQVMHAGFEDRLAVECDPEADRPGPGQVGQGLVGEVLGGFLGGEVEVGEDDDARDRMLQDLGTPARVCAGVEPLAELEAQPREHAHDAREEPSRAAEGMMVVVGPAQPEPVLPGLLDARGGVARLPVLALGLEDQMAGQVGRARQLDDPLQGRLRSRSNPFGVVVEPTPARPPEVERRQGVAGGVRLHPALTRQLAGERLETQVAAPLDRPPASSARPEPGRSGRAPSDSPTISSPRSWARENAATESTLMATSRTPAGAPSELLEPPTAERDPGKDPAGMGEDRHADRVGIRLALITQSLRADPTSPVRR